VIVAEVEALTALVVTWNVACVAPAATVTVAWTVAAELLLASVTEAAPAAAPPRVTVPADDVPPATVVGFRVTEESAGLIKTVRLAVAVWAVGVAESVTVTVKLKVPKAVGVPERTPVGLSVNPVGSAPEVIAHMYGAVPFAAVRVVWGYAELMATVASWPDAVVTLKTVLLPFVVQPATKRIAMQAEIPRTRDTTPIRLFRKSLNITPILFGL
jgi:hypothetical protein